MSDYEELDSFTENLIKRTKEREKLLNSESSDSFSLSSNESKISIKSQNVLINDNKTNIKLNECETETKAKQLVENLSKISPNRQRVPLNQRLGSIARNYNFDDSENYEYIDSDVNEDNKTITKSPTKSIRKTIDCPIDSPPKQRLRLNERLNQIAQSYYPCDDVEDRDFGSETKTKNVSKGTLTAIESNPIENRVMSSKSPQKKRIIELENKNNFNELKSVSIDKKIANNESSIKKWDKSNEKKTNENQKMISESLATNDSKTEPNVSPLKKQIESNKLKEKLSQMGFQRTEDLTSDKLIYNSNKNKRELISGSSNVSNVRKQFEQKPRNEKPENLSLKAKTSLFEKAILAENEAKGKQYLGKRNAPEVKPIQSTINKISDNKKAVEQKALPFIEMNSKRQKSSEKLSPTKGNVSNNIVVRRQLLEERLFGAETTTANAYKKELENRQKELELLKRPMNRNNLEELNCNQNMSEENKKNESNNHSIDSMDDERAEQAVCEAFEEIENYSNEQSEEEVINEENDFCLDSQTIDPKLVNEMDLNIGYESPTKRNRLYPQLFPIEENQQIESSPESSPPTKPPRLYEQTNELNTTPMRTISFYRREQSVNAKNNTPSVQTVLFKENVSQKQNFDFEKRNKKINERIEQLKQEVEQQNRIAGQASQALNLCLETNEFKGSTEQVEAERLLLISAQKRIAILNEIQKLKIKLSDKSSDTTDTTKGSLSLRNFRIQMKGEFLVARAKGTVTDVHNFVVLVYNGPNVYVTNMLNTEKDITNGGLEFEFGIALTDLNHDFQIVVHIYDLITSKHQMPHEIKYHIKKTHKKNKSSMKSPTVRSPGGPNAVLSTSFQLVGVTNINVSNHHKSSFKLENFQFSCPLEGTLKAKAVLTVQHNYNREGFFDVRDASGFWSLRWLVLKGHHLMFWRYPEDVSTKPALGSISLKECINPRVVILPSHLRHICMRPNTIAFITVAKTPKHIFTKGGSIPRSRPIKYLISADNKDDCIEWCEQLTKALNNMRLWESDLTKPYAEEEFERLLIELD